jgi:starch synthase
MSNYLIVADALFPSGTSGDAAAGVVGLAGALAAAGHAVTVFSLVAPGRLTAIPGLARRLRTVAASAGGRAHELPLFEGRLAGLPAQVVALAAEPTRASETAAFLASAGAAMARDGLIKPEIVIGWGEASASALATIGAATRLFVLPTSALGPPLSADEIADLEERADFGAGSSLAARGVISADAVIVPSPTIANELARQPGLAARATDEPVLPVQFGCDEPPHDPATDPALAATFSLGTLSGKAECRRALARRASLSLGPKTLLLATDRLEEARDGRLLLAVLRQLSGLDVAVVVPPGGDRALTDQLSVLAIEHPGKLAQLKDDGPEVARQLLAGADAQLLLVDRDGSGRGAGLAQRYGTLPLAPQRGALGDFLIDYDPTSNTGSAIVFADPTPFEIVGSIRRAIGLRADGDRWTTLVSGVLRAAPRWASMANRIDALRESTTGATPAAL